ncbi:bifunctional (p)ppGpp synthetase/guanosine-3',5'-bis(diphosphate) 3'-pyrophosphohydrolase [Lysobacter sp. 5GHs7-4]|uniref:RelA/SpoT family protein n=1 Tax=Lysobacter sp. 5GHs7-4 TaxID=2904253 RepID=UPI001E601A60|nr:bifunctional (p)ppGpp synthetase/guanosine-3',5'-bis(diphosphate) 3'-pyrophosphohydrolase [Lysobacter sp. 5GHs7-4]UHQ24225.1 bifunctional (p)ppGpp synthetase/guanosine-3',5'-bis(diphosphate) 3'-pyrophosphohydrolase [Lysobacter sp. 5GHs7-4]
MNASPSVPAPVQTALAHASAAAIAGPLRQRLEEAARDPAVARDALDAPPVVAATLDALGLLGADGDTVAAALLHAYPGLAAALGTALDKQFPAVAALLDGQRAAAQVWTLHAEHDARSGHEGLRRLLLAIVRDLRVVPILLARQLARMRNADALAPDARRELAALTRDIHAPLANRLGIWQLKWELEDLAFRYLEPQTYQKIARLLDEKRGDRERYIEQVKRTLRGALAAAGLQGTEVAGRPKHIYSIWKKMQRKDVPIGELYDLRAVRVMVGDLAACYTALGVVHAQWTPIPSEFDDYIARPKRNDYRSLHTAVVGPEGKTLEVQIRTHDMHRQAELGVAAHWKYKEVGSQAADASFDRKIAWMRKLLDAHGEGGRDNGEATLAGELDTELVEDRVYVLTPKGEVIDLPTGATPLDFAYHVHTEVGHRCRGAKVDGRIVPLDHKLRSGDRVEILTAKTGEPRRDWLVAANGFLASGRSRDKVRAWFHKLDRARNEQAGRELLDKELRRLGLLNADLAPARERFNAANDAELYVQVALGDVGPHQIGRALHEHERALAAPPPPPTGTTTLAPVPRRRPSKSTDFTVEGVGNLLVQLARCCQPLPGEPIVGYLTRGRGVSVHRPGCAAFERLAAGQPQRVLPVEWGRKGSGYETDIEVLALDRKWLLKEVTNLIAQGNAHVVSIRSDVERSGARVRLRLRLRVADYGQLSTLLGKLSSLPGVEQAQRC